MAADIPLAVSAWGRSEGTPEGNVEIPSQPKFSGLLVFGKPVAQAAHSCHSSTQSPRMKGASSKSLPTGPQAPS